MAQEALIRTSDNGTMFAVILNLPARSSLNLDGQSILLHRDDFVGIAGIPLDGFHLLAIRPNIANSKDKAATASSGAKEEPVFASITTAFVLPTTSPPISDGSTPCCLMRQYDPHTEEVSDNPLDEVTRSNLQYQIQQEPPAMDPQRLIPYASVMRSEASALSWREATSFITLDLLTSRGIPPGTKIVPGSSSTQDEDGAEMNFVNETLQDGHSPRYPHIPVLEYGRPRMTTHRGTKAFLQNLTPMERTALLTDKNASTEAFRRVLEDVYRGNWRDLLGDLQLAFTLFLNLHCYSSLEHWRDVLALSCRVSPDCVQTECSALFASLVQVLSTQIQSMDGNLLDDMMDLSEDNFLVPSLQRLCQTMSSSPPSSQTWHTDNGLQRAGRDLMQLLRDRLPQHFGTNATASAEDDNNDRVDRMVIDGSDNDADNVDDDDEDDGPVVVAEEEVQAAYQRQAVSDGRTRGVRETHPPEMRARFPILFAAQQVHEDIVMTCARALEAATDVSLVREAADYLEQVEARKQQQQQQEAPSASES